MLHKDMNKPIVNQVAMIESKFEKQDSLFYGKKVHLPAAVFNKSPSRMMPGGMQSPNRLGTPSRLQGKVTSPIRFRKQMEPNKLSNYFTQPNMLGSGNTQKRSRGQPFLSNSGANCSNMSHGLKPASFIVQMQNSNFLFCEKCAILYASQGYKVQRMEKASQYNAQYNKSQILCMLQNPERRSQLMTFLNQIKKISTNLNELKGEAESVLKSNNNYFKDQEMMIEEYFNRIKETIDSQKYLLLEQFKSLQQQVNRTPESQLQKIMAGISDCESMKQDIYDSVEIIRQVDDDSFETVILAYKSKAKEIKSMNYLVQQSIDLPRIVGQDVQDLSRKIVGMINFRVETGDKNQQVEQQQFNPLKHKQSSVYFSFDNQNQQQQLLVSNEPQEQQHQQNQQEDIRNSLAQYSSNLNYEYGDL